ncbi:MAG: zinc-binding dehydrogenase, partial [Nitrososphaerota archaeon]|nr:zinc-binding dehydrogenase [Nitrososphaerota archaeon]
SLGMTLNGALAEYVVCPVRNLVPFPDSLSFEEGALAGGTVAVPFSAIRKLGNLTGRWTLVFGLGALGFNAVQILKASGARVIAVGRKETKLETARGLGADETFDSSKGDYAEFARRAAGGEGVDFAVDLAGAAEEVPRLMRSLRRGGRLVIIGYSSGNFEAQYQSVALDALQIIGSRSYTRQDLRGAIDLIAVGKVKPLVASRYALGEANDALCAVKTAKLVGRAVVAP